MAQTSTLLHFLFRKNTAKLLLLLLFFVTGARETYGQATATLPTGHDGPWQSGTRTGWIFSGLALDKAGNMGTSQTGGSANFTTVGSYIEINFDDVASQVSFWIKAEGARSFRELTFAVYEKQVGGVYVLAGEKKFTATSSTSGEKVAFNVQPTTRTVKLELLSVTGGTATVDDVRISKAVPKINIKQGVTDLLSSSGVYDFGRYIVGDQSQKATFTIENNGNAELRLTSIPIITVAGANPSDFIVDFSTTATSIAPGNSTTFGIIFKPTASGNRSATITIANNDAELNPYTFTVTGVSAYCPTIERLDTYSGIVGTYVYIYGKGFDKTTLVTFGGVEANFYVVDENLIDVQVPEGALTGPVEVFTEDCSAKSQIFTVLKPTTSISKTELNMSAVVGASETVQYQLSAEYLNDGASVAINFSDAAGDYTISRSADGPFVKSLTFTDVIVEETADGVVTNRKLAPTDIWIKYTPVSAGVSSATLIHATEDGENQILTINGTATAPACAEIERLDIYQGRIGDYVYIYGNGFDRVSRVTFGGVDANFYVVDENLIDVQVPEGALTGPVEVFTAECSDQSEIFKVLKPTITLSTKEMEISSAVGAYETQLYVVSAEYLNDGASVTIDVSGIPGDYTISRSEEGPFVKTLTIEDNIFDNTLGTTEIWVRYAPAASGASSVVVAHSTEGADVETLTVNGTAIAPLPVELISFKAQKQQNAVLLTWVTASEKDNSHFDVEMTNDAKGEFKAVGKINSKATNSSVKTNYEFSHSGSFTGTRYYRLKQVDLDGTTSYSNVIAVEMAALVQEKVKVAPNPISPESKLLFPAAEAGKLNITIVNMSGSKVATKSADVEAGTNTIELGLSDKLPSGIYILTTEFNGKTEQVKLIKQ